MNRPLRWGILSTAHIGQVVVPGIRQASNSVAAAVASRDLRAAQAFARPFEIPLAFGSYEELLASPEVDAVYVPLPNHLHKEWSIRAAEHGKHVLVEKPFALNEAEVDTMMAAAAANHVLLAEAFMYRYHSQFARLQELIAQRAIGDVRVVRSTFCYTMRGDRNIRRFPEMGGGALMDVGCYCINMSRLVARAVFGARAILGARAEPVEVQASAVYGETGVDMRLAALLRFPGGILAQFDCAFDTDYREWLEIQGTEGCLRVPRPIKPDTRPGEIWLDQKETGAVPPTRTTITTPAGNHYRWMVERFAKSVLDGTPLAFPPEEGRANMRVIDAVAEAARTGEKITLSGWDGGEW